MMIQGRSYEQITQDVRPSTVYTTTTPDGKIVAWARKYSNANAQEVERIATQHFNCRTCTSRAHCLVTYGGPNGPLMFAGEVMPTLCPTINSLHQIAMQTCQGEQYTIELVKPDTFPKSAYSGPGSQSTSQWHHWTVIPSHVTHPELVQRMTQLWSKTQHSVIDRLGKFLCDGARDTMVIINQIIQSGQLVRPEYWTTVCAWVLGFQQKFPVNFGQMSSAMRDELCAYAMATGHAVGEVHYNFQTSENLLNFMVMTSEHAIATAMDKRSDPRTNQVSQLARAKASKGVVAKFGIGLIWDGKVYKDDLDLRIVTRRFGTVYFGMKELIYNGKVVAKLDFDAGISGTEAEPAENVSFNEEIVGETIQIWIDAYSHRTRGDVPCTIIITQQGLPDKVIDVVWPKDRRSHDYLHVATHVFTPITEPVVAMSETQARAVAAQDKEWNELFGVPTSTVATLDNLVSHGVPVLMMPEYKAPEPATPESAMSEFAKLMVSARQPKTTAPNGKQFLSQRMKVQPPTSLEELWRRFADKQCLSLSVHLQDFVPGLITQITVASAKALKTGTNTALALCHYEDKFQHPLKPVKTGNARVDESWVPSSYDRTTQVTAIAKVDGKYFFVFNGAQLSPDDVAFPKSAGFYPQDLSNDGHKHRSKWAFLNTSIKPQMPANGSVPAIGAFLTSDTATVVIDGQKLVLRV